MGPITGSKAAVPGPAVKVDPILEQAKKDFATFTGASYSFPNYTVGTNGKFDFTYSPSAKQASVNVRVKFDFPDVKGNAFEKFMSTYTHAMKFITQATSAWSGQYQFENVRAPQAVWGKLNPLSVKVNVVPVTKNEHFTVRMWLHKADGPGDPTAVGGGVTTFHKGDYEAQERFNPQTREGEIKRAQRITPSPIKFENDGVTIKAVYKDKLRFLATYLKRISNPPFTLNLVGHANNVGDAAYNKALSERRAQEVSDFLQSAGLTNHTIVVSGVGEDGATASPDWRKVTIDPTVPVGWKNQQATMQHEFGHMIGLGDEYAGGTPTSTHYNLTKKAFGQDYADQVAKRGDTDYASIMEGGDDVRIQHYVTFWAALADTTLQKAPVPTPKFGYNDWRFVE